MRGAFKTNKILKAIHIKWEYITMLKAAHIFYWGIIIFPHNCRTLWHIILERDKEFRRCINQVLAFATIYDKPLPLSHCRATVYPRSILKSVPLPKQRLHLSLTLWADRYYLRGRPFDISEPRFWNCALSYCQVPTECQLSVFQSRYRGLLKGKKKVILVRVQAWKHMGKQRTRSSDS